MKRRILLLIALLQFTVVAFSQKTMSYRFESDDIAREASGGQGVIAIRSSYDLSFEVEVKNKTEKIKPQKTEQVGDTKLYHLLFSTSSKISERILKISCKGYTTLRLPIKPVTFAIKQYYVWDEEGTIGVSEYKKSINEGKAYFASADYLQARDKFMEASDAFAVAKEKGEAVSDSELAFIDEMFDKATKCADLIEEGDNAYQSGIYDTAIEKYQEVRKINADDAHCVAQIELCKDKIANAPREITGVVTKNGKPIAEAVVMVVTHDKKGKRKKDPNALRTTTDAAGRYTIKVLNKTKEITCWEGMSRPKFANIEGKDSINFSF